jgi:hypothetical protein
MYSSSSLKEKATVRKTLSVAAPSQAEGMIEPEELDPENTGAYLNGFTTWSAPSVGRPGTSSE